MFFGLSQAVSALLVDLPSIDLLHPFTFPLVYHDEDEYTDHLRGIFPSYIPRQKPISKTEKTRNGLQRLSVSVT
jgi:hypothetical protein